MQSGQSTPGGTVQLPDDLARVSIDDLDKLAKQRAEQFAKQDNLETSQIRNVYSSIVRIRMAYNRGDREIDELIEQLIMLRPKIAYAVGRKRNVRGFGNLFLEAIDRVKESSDKDKALQNFFWLAEAVVAYHRFHGGRD